MPDTPENQAAYPQHCGQKPGCGFPMARVVVLLSLATGAVLDLAIAWSGKLTGENALLRGLRGRLRRGDILLADSYYSSYQEVAALLAMGVDVVMRQHGGRPSDFRRGTKLGREDHLVEWQRGRNRRTWMSRRRSPAAPVARDARAAGAGRQAGVPDQGVRGRDQPAGPEAYPPQELAGLYRRGGMRSWI